MHQQQQLLRRRQRALGMTRQEILQQQMQDGKYFYVNVYYRGSENSLLLAIKGLLPGSRGLAETSTAPPSVLLIEVAPLGPPDKLGLCTSSATASVRRIALLSSDGMPSICSFVSA